MIVVGCKRIIFYIFTKNNVKMTIKTCLECTEPIRGRSDKKFCSDYCRNTYNNKINKESRNLVRNINNRLRKNYKILCELNATGKTRVSKMRLLDRNFDFQHFTSIYTTKKGTVYYFCYDQGYLEIDSNYYILIKRD